MTRYVRAIVGGVSALAIAIIITATVQIREWNPSVYLFWAFVCMASEFFWVRSAHNDSAGSLGGTARLTTAFMFGPWVAAPIIFTGTLAGLVVFSRPPWYKALYNSSQLTLASVAAGMAYAWTGGPILFQLAPESSLLGIAGAASILASGSFLAAFAASGLTYYVVNNAVMVWLMSAVTQRRMSTLLRENVFYPEAITSSVGLILYTPLFVLLYGALGIPGLTVLFLCLGLMRAAEHRFAALVRAQDNLVRGERMAAMGDMAEEIGVALGTYLEEIKGRSGKLMDWAAESREQKLLRSAEQIHVNVDQIAIMVGGLVAFSHRNTMKEQTDINGLLTRTIEFVRPQNRFDGIEFEFEPDLLPRIEADPGQVQQVLINLLTNAADAIHESGAETKRIRIETAFDPKSRVVKITVTDSGPGIPKQTLPRMFEPHFTTKRTGHGYGLSTAFRIAANHHGRIHASNLPEGGARLELELPAA